VNADFHVPVVDDNSPDRTGGNVQSLSEKNFRVHLLSRIENWPWLRRQLSLMANRLARGAVGHEIGDWTSGYRCYRRHVIEKLSIDSLRSNGYSFLVEVLAACLQLGCRVTEVPITFCDRRSGRSKLSRVEILKGMLTLLRLGMKRIVFAGVSQR
jgi:dolichol-phosphate mannosyltransferase